MEEWQESYTETRERIARACVVLRLKIRRLALRAEQLLPAASRAILGRPNTPARKKLQAEHSAAMAEREAIEAKKKKLKATFQDRWADLDDAVTMNQKTALGLALLAVACFGGRSSGARKISPGAKILLVGDSQSVGEVSPGGQLARALTVAGFKVRVLAVGGKTAYYYSLSAEGKAKLSAELAQRPAAVLVFLGTNELANVAFGGLGYVKGQVKGHQALKDLIVKAGARPLFVGPPNFRDNVKPEAGGEPLVSVMPALVPRLASVYGADNWIDARPSTPDHKGVHFDATGAASFALALAPRIIERLTR